MSALLRLHQLQLHRSRLPILTGILKVTRLHKPQSTLWRFLASLHLNSYARQILSMQRTLHHCGERSLDPGGANVRLTAA